MRILAGDIGGTKTALGLYERSPSGEHRVIAEDTYRSAEHAGLAEVLRLFLAPLSGDQIAVAAFGVAGPVVAGTCTTTNLPWTVVGTQLESLLHAPVRLINDFHATALGVLELDPAQLLVLQPGVLDPSAPFAVIGAGTGLGEAIGVPTPQGVRILETEGGQADFSARDELETRLSRFLRERHGRVSVERVVSGLGLAEVYDFVVADGLAPERADTRARFETELPGAVITQLATQKSDLAAQRALAIFVSAYGAEAGNFALRVLPRGGVYVAGGIAARLGPWLCESGFMTSFLDKGSMSKILQSIRVTLVLNSAVGLLGARAYAAL